MSNVWDVVNHVAIGALKATAEQQKTKNKFLREAILRQQPHLGFKDYMFLNIMRQPEESHTPKQKEFLDSYWGVRKQRPLTRVVGDTMYQYDHETGDWFDTGISKGTKAGGIKSPSYTDQFRQDVLGGTNRIKEGETPDSVITELREKYPTTFSSTHEWNLKTIGKKAQAELGGYRNQAIQELKKMGYPTTENNVRSAIKQLRQPRGE